MVSPNIKRIITEALKEDCAHMDITTNALIGRQQISEARIRIKENAVLCGVEVLRAVFRILDSNLRVRCLHRDGQRVRKNTTIAILRGRTRALLQGERTALNFLSHLSGIATKTNDFVRAARSRKTKIFDTRKTIPNLRVLAKYAVRCGGGENHRSDLSSMILIKDNHKQALDVQYSIPEMIRKAKQQKKKIEIEVESLREFKEALQSNPDMILLDNMNLSQIRTAVLLRNKSKKKKTLLEVSGGITLNKVRALAQTGVDRISVGALTHTIKAIDVSMELKDT